MTSFPDLAGESLSRKRYRIPADLEGRTNLVFVAFLQHQQRDIDAWLARLGDLESQYSGLYVYEIPLLPRYPKVYRRFIDGGMRAGIPDPKTRDRTITVYTDRSAFLGVAGLDGEDQIWVVLLDGEGSIVWSHIGPVTDAAERGLEDMLQALID